MRISNVEKVWKDLLGQASSRRRRGIPSEREGKIRNWRRSQVREPLKNRWEFEERGMSCVAKGKSS